MKLDRYLREHGLTLLQFGKLSGIGLKQTVHQYRHGLRFPTPENLRRIREATNGAVTADDFVDQHTGASPSKPRARRARKPSPEPDPAPPSRSEVAAE
jgi:transcriptional regulator with XRE-family HTH domain